VARHRRPRVARTRRIFAAPALKPFVGEESLTGDELLDYRQRPHVVANVVAQHVQLGRIVLAASRRQFSSQQRIFPLPAAVAVECQTPTPEEISALRPASGLRLQTILRMFGQSIRQYPREAAEDAGCS